MTWLRWEIGPGTGSRHCHGNGGGLPTVTLSSSNVAALVCPPSVIPLANSAAHAAAALQTAAKRERRVFASGWSESQA